VHLDGLRALRDGPEREGHVEDGTDEADGEARNASAILS
jgi:hypothetical protein